MKTGTPPRVDGRSIDYTRTEEQQGDEHPGKFSFLPEIPLPEKQLSCHITYTNPDVHDILREGFDRSPMFNGRIRGVRQEGIAPVLRTRSTVLQKRNGTRYSLNQKGGILLKLTSTDSVPACRKRSN